MESSANPLPNCICISCKSKGFTAMSDNNTVFCNTCGMEYKFAGGKFSPPSKCVHCGNWSCYCPDSATNWALSSICCVCDMGEVNPDRPSNHKGRNA